MTGWGGHEEAHPQKTVVAKFLVPGHGFTQTTTAITPVFRFIVRLAWTDFTEVHFIELISRNPMQLGESPNDSGPSPLIIRVRHVEKIWKSKTHHLDKAQSTIRHIDNRRCGLGCFRTRKYDCWNSLHNGKSSTNCTTLSVLANCEQQGNWKQCSKWFMIAQIAIGYMEYHPYAIHEHPLLNSKFQNLYVLIIACTRFVQPAKYKTTYAFEKLIRVRFDCGPSK